MRFETPLFLLSLLHQVTATSSSPTIRKIFTFPNNTFIENIAARSNSKLLVTSESVPTLYSIDPTVSVPTASVVYTFPNGTGISGITEIVPDVFVVASGVWIPAETRVVPGTLDIWTVNLNTSPPRVKHITTVVNTTIFNGIDAIPGTSLVLAADSEIGAIWKVNILTGAASIAFSDPLLAPVPSPVSNLGINGLKYHLGYAYFTNSAQGIFGRVRVDHTGAKIGAVEVLSYANVTATAVYDDFAFDLEGNPWIASHPDFAIEVKANGAQNVIANSTLLLNPTAASFGRGSLKEKKTLYITNGGQFTPDFTLYNEGVVAIDL